MFFVSEFQHSRIIRQKPELCDADQINSSSIQPSAQTLGKQAKIHSDSLQSEVLQDLLQLVLILKTQNQLPLFFARRNKFSSNPKALADIFFPT